jgi:hypothetical protein
MIVNGFPRGVKIYTDQVSGLAVSAVANTPGSITISWTQPSSKLYKGVTLVYKTGSYPTSPTDGTVVYVAKGTVTKTIIGLTGGTTYYVRAFAKATNTSGSKVYYNTTTTGAQAGRATISSPVTNFKASAYSNDDTHLYLSWTVPVGLHTSIMIRYKVGSYPTSPTDGTLYYSGTGTVGSATVGALTGGTGYFFRVFVYNSENAFNSNTSQQDNEYTVTSPITNLAVAKTSSTSLTVSWTPPSGNYSGVLINYKVGSYPTSVTDGTQWYYGKGTSMVIDGLSPNTVYYIRAFTALEGEGYNTNTSQQATQTTKTTAGSVIFTSSQSWTVPAGVRSIDVFAVGGGGGGGGSDTVDGTPYNRGSGGGGGYTTIMLSQAVTPGSSISVTIGAGGAGGTTNKQGTTGGTSSFGAIASANGGVGGMYGKNSGRVGGDGGAGGGAGGYIYTGGSVGGTGGSNGSAGGNTSASVTGGLGQGTTTREFGSGTLYSGGGGGAAQNAGAGGAGGGGAGGTSTGGNASPNTGGGGGGGQTSGGSGGSGIIVVKWAEQ